MSNPENTKKQKPVIGITIGDINSISPEVIIKALNDSRILNLLTPVIYGSSKVLSYYRKMLDLNDFNFGQLQDKSHLNHKKINVVNCWEEVIEIHSGHYADAVSSADRNAELEKIVTAVDYARSLDLQVNAGHGLNYVNVQAIAAINDIIELNIGHSIISQAIFTGMHEAVREMKKLMQEVRS